MARGPYSLPAIKRAVLRLLVVSRESAVLGPLWSVGESNGWQLESATSGWGAMERVQSGVTPDLLILDVPHADKDGLHFLRWLRRLRPELPILVLCDREDSTTQQEAIRLGARECLAKPLRIRHWRTQFGDSLPTAWRDLLAKAWKSPAMMFRRSVVTRFFVAASPVDAKAEGPSRTSGRDGFSGADPR